MWFWWSSFYTFQFSSVTQSGLTLCDPMDCSTSGLPIHHQLPEFTQIHVHQKRCHPTISSSVVPFSSHLQSFQHQGLFQWVSSSHQVAKVLEFQLQHQLQLPMISFRMDWLDLLAVQGTFKNLLQHHSSKASILQHSAFFMVWLSHLYMTLEKP